MVDENLHFSNHIIDKVNEANQTMGTIRRTIVYLNKPTLYEFGITTS